MLWQHHGIEEATWEREDTMSANYPFLFKEEGMFKSLMLNDCCICMRFVCAMCENFGTKFF